MRNTARTVTIAATALVGIAVGAAQCADAATSNDVTVTVERVVDGDTFVISPELNGSDRVRPLGIDTPETWKTVECYGPEATAYAAELLPIGSTVTLTYDSIQPVTDNYGRTLAYVTMQDGTDFSTAMAAAEMADSTSFNIERRWDIDAAVGDAKHNGTGMWGAC